MIQAVSVSVPGPDDPDGAEEAMRAHLVSALERLETFVDGGSASAEARQISKLPAGSVKD